MLATFNYLTFCYVFFHKIHSLSTVNTDLDKNLCITLWICGKLFKCLLNKQNLSTIRGEQLSYPRFLHIFTAICG